MSIPEPPEPTRRSRPRDKLIPRETMEKFLELTELGVPIAVCKRNLELGILQSTCSTLLKFYKLAEKLAVMDSEKAKAMANTIEDSLFPPWLTETVNTPKNMAYYGPFPYGYWKEDT